MVKKGIGGANTKTGLAFEGEKELCSFFKKQENYEIKNMFGVHNKNKNDAFEVLYKGKHVANIFKKHAIYVYLKKYHNLDWNLFLTKKLLPDDSIFVYKNNTFFIIEIKTQNVVGSVDEKLQTCDFKRKQWQKLLSILNCKVEYWYLLSEWFKKPEYKDTLNYIINSNCRYFFEYIPLKELNLPL
ncbi:hypothetical protein [Spiroplasma endosymbiont of Polydrusus pterygomalis]|uniref:hypothetical protein n=1 Tax=Spiroplasma endosymbiont of Polydrusus pterygomalis TaxID=3139327 RepID=UPI003CCAAC38